MEETNNSKTSTTKKTSFNLDPVAITFEAIQMDKQELTHKFNSYATVKIYAIGFFTLILMTTNVVQLKQLISPSHQAPITEWTPRTVLLLFFICTSILFLIVISILLVINVKKQDEFGMDDKRKRIVQINNLTTLFISIMAVFNVIINVLICI